MGTLFNYHSEHVGYKLDYAAAYKEKGEIGPGLGNNNVGRGWEGAHADNDCNRDSR